jgi:hypothetical protein
MSLRQRALHLLRRRTFEQHANLLVGSAILRRHGLYEAMEQGHHGGDVLACPSKVRKGSIIGDDPLVYVTGRGVCAPAVSMTFDLAIDFHVFPHELLSGLVNLQLLSSQLLHPYTRWAAASPAALLSG